MGCLQLVSFTTQWKTEGKIQASRGLRQGHPLSPFLFTLGVDVQSRLMERAQNVRLIKGFVIGKDKIMVSHLQLLMIQFFFRSNDEEKFTNLVKVVDFFCAVPGLRLNLKKSYISGVNISGNKLLDLVSSVGCEW